MKTVKTVRIHAETDRLQFAYWIDHGDDKEGEFVPLDNLSKGELERIAPLLGMTPLGIAALNMLVGDIKETVGIDLTSIWQRLDDAGIK